MTAPIVIGLALREDDAAPLALGSAIARLTGAPLALVSAYVHDPALPRPLPENDAVLLSGTLAALEECAESLRPEHEVEVHARRGAPTRSLHELAEQLGAGLLVVGSSHRGRLGRVLSGSVTASVLHGASCAVAVAPRGYTAADRLERIAVAYDGSDESRDALAAAVGLALFAGGSVDSYTVTEPAAHAPAMTVPGWSIPAAYDESRRAHADSVAEQVSDLVPPEVMGHAEVLVGPPGPALAAISHDADLLICGSRGYGALRSVALGGVSRALVNEAACPVLVMPRGDEPHRLEALVGRRHASSRS
jgi:nucleotide-binding universal stress UspA family protein